MIFDSKIVRQFDDVLDWNSVRKSGLVLGILIAIFVHYGVFQLYQIYFPSIYINYDMLMAFKWAIPLLILFTIGLLLLGKRVDQFSWARSFYPYACTIYYSLTLALLGYMIGLSNMTTGLVMAGAPLFGFVLFKRQIIYTAFTLGAVVVLLLSWLSSYSYIPYGPLFHFEFFYRPEARPFYLACMVYFAVPHFLFIFGFCDLFFIRWRQRERNIHKVSITDGLTNLYNRRAITKLLELSLDENLKLACPVSIILLDVDLFKRINDQYGHAVGDKALQAVSATLQNILRKVDQLGRYGGEEFLIVLSQTELEQAVVIAERCRQAISDAILYDEQDEKLQVTASFGVSSSTHCGYQIDKLVRQADKYLYQAKEQGRNQVVSILNTVTL